MTITQDKKRELAHLITEAWRRKAPLKLLKAFDAASLLPRK